MFIPFGAGLIDLAITFAEQAAMLKLYPTYYNRDTSLTTYNISEMVNDIRIGELRRKIEEFKWLLKRHWINNVRLGCIR